MFFNDFCFVSGVPESQKMSVAAWALDLPNLRSWLLRTLTFQDAERFSSRRGCASWPQQKARTRETQEQSLCTLNCVGLPISDTIFVWDLIDDNAISATQSSYGIFGNSLSKWKDGNMETVIILFLNQDIDIWQIRTELRLWHNCTLLKIEHFPGHNLFSDSLIQAHNLYIHCKRLNWTLSQFAYRKPPKFQASNSFKWPDSHLWTKRSYSFMHPKVHYHIPHKIWILQFEMFPFLSLKFRPPPFYGRYSSRHCIRRQNLREQQAQSWSQQGSCHVW
jgi:hypothetical protein